LNKSTISGRDSPGPEPHVGDHAAVDANATAEAADSSASEDWDVVGSEAEDAPAGVASLGKSEAMRTPERSIFDESFPTDRLDWVPMFDTGEPQYAWGHGGGRPPRSSKLYMAVLLASAEDGVHSYDEVRLA
jgi:hypothetical protein